MFKDVIIILSFSFTIIIFFYLFVNPNKKILGRTIWHEPMKLIDYKLDGDATSKQVFDIYSFSHITHGIILYFILKILGFKNIIYIAVLIEIIWELFENTSFIINKYRKKKEFKNFTGDSIVNMIGDVMATIIGIYLAYISHKIAILYVIGSELILYPLGANLLYLSIGSLINI
jgi:hypothetical protein